MLCTISSTFFLVIVKQSKAYSCIQSSECKEHKFKEHAQYGVLPFSQLKCDGIAELLWHSVNFPDSSASLNWLNGKSSSCDGFCILVYLNLNQTHFNSAFYDSYALILNWIVPCYKCCIHVHLLISWISPLYLHPILIPQ